MGKFKAQIIEHIDETKEYIEKLKIIHVKRKYKDVIQAVNDEFDRYNRQIKPEMEKLNGHEHIASILEGDRIFINPGSLGCPHPNKDMARYGILELNEEIKYTQFEFKYDSVCVVRDMYEKNMPNKDFISSNFYKIKMDEFDI